MDSNRSIKEVEKMLSRESGLYLDSADELNGCINHIVSLLRDSEMLYFAGSSSTSIALSITALEEVGKTHVALFAKRASDNRVSHDPLRDHKSKQIIGTSYTITMSARLTKAVGRQRLEELFAMSYGGELKTLRERMLYWDRPGTDLLLPEQTVDAGLARDLLLLAIESFDDNLVGYTNESFAISRETDAMFERVSTEAP